MEVESNIRAENIANTQVVPHKLCAVCVKAFSSSKVLQATLAKGHDYEDMWIADPQKRNEDKIRFDIQQLDERLQRRVEVLQSQIDSGGNPNARDDLQSINQRRDSYRSILKSREYVEHHQNLEGWTASLKEACHFCIIMAAIRHGVRGVHGVDKKIQQTAIQIALLEWPSFASLELRLSRDDDLWVLEQHFNVLRSEMMTSTRLSSELQHPPNVGLPDPSRDTMMGSDMQLELGRCWLEECVQKHPRCQSQPARCAPRRLVELNGTSKSALTLRLSQDHDKQAPYCALSYRWGTAKDKVVLKKANLRDFESGIALKGLPATIQDAVQITHSLGQKFLWVDSLCIIQDSEQDWAVESRSMSTVYQFAVCTIVAEGPQDSSEGIFRKRFPLSYLPCVLVSNDTTSIVVMPPFYPGMATSSMPNLARRGWCFQERVASSRLLVFGNMGIRWTCGQGEASEWNLEGKGYVTLPLPLLDPKVTMETRKIFGSTVQQAEWEPALLSGTDVNHGRSEYNSLTTPTAHSFADDVHRAHCLWFALAGPFSTTELTYKSDKLVALAGLASRIQRTTNFCYLAGLWRETLGFDLLWTLRHDSKTGRLDYRAPSWSWASVDGSIASWMHTDYDVPATEFVYKLKSWIIEPKDAQDILKTGAVRFASLTVTGSIRHLPEQCMTKPEADIDIWYKTCHTIIWHDSYIGRFRPDYLNVDLSNVYLFPIARGTRLDSFGAKGAGPVWATFSDATYNKLTKAKFCICGLALIRSSKATEQYERVGFFHFDFRSRDDIAATWFDEIEERDITIV